MKELFNEIMSHLCRAETELFRLSETSKNTDYEEIRHSLDILIDKLHELAPEE